MITEAIHTPFMSDRYLAIENAKYIFNNMKNIGDEVLSGTVNGSGLLQVEVTRLVADTTMQRIIRLVTEAQATKAKQEKFIDKFASIYTPIVMLVNRNTASASTS